MINLYCISNAAALNLAAIEGQAPAVKGILFPTQRHLWL